MRRADANILYKEVSDGIIAAVITEKALEILKKKRKEKALKYLRMDPSYVPPQIEHKDVFGITFEQRRNDLIIGDELLSNIVTREKNLARRQQSAI
jgi:AICAR transformylase/IMP cyclohydrolase PurH